MFRTRSRGWAAHEQVDSIKWAFRESCRGIGLSNSVDAPVAGTSAITPEVASVRLGPPLQLTVRMPCGLLPEHLGRVGHRIAPHLGGVALRVADRGHGWAVATVLAVDPLEGVLSLHLARPDLLLGRAEDGRDITLGHPRELPHIVVQGQTRSGKSVWLYSLLAQVVRETDVQIAGVDPSGITLRPMVNTRHGCRVVLGLANVTRIEKVLAELVAEMDARLASMPGDRDTLPTSTDTPVILLVLDEYPGLLRALDAARTRDHDPGKRVRALVARLLAESHKVGFRVVIAAQRAEAAIIGAAERAQCAGRLSFRTDTYDSIKLLHPDVLPDLAAEHTSAEAGIALLSWPGRELTRIRGPLLGEYRDYAAAVAAA